MKKSDRLRDQDRPCVLGYELDPVTLTPLRRYVGDQPAGAEEKPAGDRFAIRVKTDADPEKQWLNREKVIDFIVKSGGIIDPVGNPVTIWATVPRLTAAHLGRYLRRWADHVIDACG